MHPESFLERIETINIYRRRNERAPNKPLYLLLCIAELQKGNNRLLSFSYVEKVLGEALVRFGLPTKPVSPQYPFWRLQNDGLSEVVPQGPYRLRGNGSDPTKTSLREMNAQGGLLRDDFEYLKGNLDLQTLVVHKILDNHFPRSIHDDIVDFFGLRLSGPRSTDNNTECEFRVRVLKAYNNVCALSGFSLKYRGALPGLEAAHICWQQAGGNDEVSNGIAMSSLFRKLFHLGLFTIDEDLKIQFAQEVAESAGSRSILNLSGTKLRVPASRADQPDLDALAWHREWVFRG